MVGEDIGYLGTGVKLTIFDLSIWPGVQAHPHVAPGIACRVECLTQYTQARPEGGNGSRHKRAASTRPLTKKHKIASDSSKKRKLACAAAHVLLPSATHDWSSCMLLSSAWRLARIIRCCSDRTAVYIYACMRGSVPQYNTAHERCNI